MTTYLLAYRTPQGYTPGGDDATAAWNTFFEGIKDHVVDPGNPVFSRTSLGDCGVGVNPLGGYSVVEADDLEAAATLAKDCPVLAIGGGVEVGEITNLDIMRTVPRSA
jgi:hypothetical protein